MKKTVVGQLLNQEALVLVQEDDNLVVSSMIKFSYSVAQGIHYNYYHFHLLSLSKLAFWLPLKNN